MLQHPLFGVAIVAAVLILATFLIPAFIRAFLRDVSSGTIRMVTWWGGSMKIYRGPGKSFELPILTNGTTISSKAINVDLDITDQTADVDRSGIPNPIKVRVLASAIVSVGDSDELIKTAANRFFAKTDDEQMSTLTDLLSSSGRRAVNLRQYSSRHRVEGKLRHWRDAPRAERFIGHLHGRRNRSPE